MCNLTRVGRYSCQNPFFLEICQFNLMARTSLAVWFINKFICDCGCQSCRLRSDVLSFGCFAFLGLTKSKNANKNVCPILSFTLLGVAGTDLAQ